MVCDRTLETKSVQWIWRMDFVWFCQCHAAVLASATHIARGSLSAHPCCLATMPVVYAVAGVPQIFSTLRQLCYASTAASH